MKKLFKALGNKKGFTLIELLVVIGILGVLAAALIATIDPFEQIKKAQDSNAKNATVEFVDASIRYYATHNQVPWVSALAPNTGCNSANGGNIVLGASDACLSILIADGELKDQFTASNNLTSIRYMGGPNAVTACFLPTSKSQMHDPNTIYLQNGSSTTQAYCAANTGSCYWCAK